MSQRRRVTRTSALLKRAQQRGAIDGAHAPPLAGHRRPRALHGLVDRGLVRFGHVTDLRAVHGIYVGKGTPGLYPFAID